MPTGGVIPKTGMILAAGLGTRMRPLTLYTPKPLIPVLGRTMLDRMLDLMRAAGVARIAVNLHHKGEMVRAHLAGQSDILLSDETGELLETGGGVARALPLLGEDAFFVANSDVVVLDGYMPTLHRLGRFWRDADMDALLLMQRTPAAFGYDGPGDFFLDPLGRPRRRREREVAPLLFAGVQILHPRLFAGAPAGRFSLNRLYDRALAAGRLWGIVHDGEWYHVGTPEALAEAEARMGERAAASGK